MGRLKNSLLIAAGGIGGLLGLGGLGLRVPPRAHRPPGQSADFGQIRLSESLPRPVYRHFHRAYGQTAPIVRSAVFLGRARFRRGAWLWMRFAAYHDVGREFWRDMEVTWFGLPVVRGIDSYVDGQGIMNINGQISRGAEIDQGAFLALWAEALLFPSATIGQPGFEWQAVDETTARLSLPFGQGHEVATLTFDATTGFLRRFLAERYKRPNQPKVLWRVEYLGWRPFGAALFPSQVKVTWEDEGQPWFVATMDDVVLNAPLVGRPQAT
jgi:hypothetical protein